MSNFLNEKKLFLAKPDKSLAGKADNAILPLIKSINFLENYYTTSSCAGRIVLIKEKGKKQKAAYLFRSHEHAKFEEIKKNLNDAVKKTKETVYFKHEPAILHVACSTMVRAQELVNAARACGWKKSGIIASQNKIIAEIVSVEILSTPIAVDGKIIINEDYLKILVLETNKKLNITRKKIKNLEGVLRKWQKKKK
jgi:tRNA wybutosine-synthesizing protein 3